MRALRTLIAAGLIVGVPGLALAEPALPTLTASDLPLAIRVALRDARIGAMQAEERDRLDRDRRALAEKMRRE